MNGVWLAMILFLAAVAVLAAAQVLPQPVRVAGMFLFLCVCPGLAYVPVFKFGPPALELLIALGASFAMNTLVATALVLMHAWSMQTALLAMICVTMLGVLLQLALQLPALRRQLQQDRAA
jgi:hypothetical protein